MVEELSGSNRRGEEEDKLTLPIANVEERNISLKCPVHRECQGGSSVGCVLSGAQKVVESAFDSSPVTAGAVAVRKAATGRGFSWDRGIPDSTVASAGHNVVLAAAKGKGDILGEVWKQYENLDHEIDYGGRTRMSHRVLHQSLAGSSPDTDLRETIRDLKAEKARLSKILKINQKKKIVKQGKRAVKKAGNGWLNWIDGWDNGDTKAPNVPWAY